MRRNHLKNIHPGQVIKDELLIPLEIRAYRLSKDTGIPQTRISEILKGNRRVTADTALNIIKAMRSKGFMLHASGFKLDRVR